MQFGKATLSMLPLAFLTLSCGSNSNESSALARSCNTDLLRVCLANEGGEVGCQKHRGKNNCSASDVARVKSADSTATQATSSKTYIWPTASHNVTSSFGPRKNPCQGCSSFHQGIDIGVFTGAVVFASAAGNAEASWSSCGGRMVRVGSSSEATRYLHLSSYVASGKYVPMGQVIARSGNTGSCTTGPHLHFEIIRNGTPVNPVSFLR